MINHGNMQDGCMALMFCLLNNWLLVWPWLQLKKEFQALKSGIKGYLQCHSLKNMFSVLVFFHSSGCLYLVASLGSVWCRKKIQLCHKVSYGYIYTDKKNSIIVLIHMLNFFKNYVFSLLCLNRRNEKLQRRRERRLTSWETWRRKRDELSSVTIPRLAYVNDE